MRIDGLSLAVLASLLVSAPSRAGTTVLDFTGVTITPVAYEPSEKVTYGRFTLRNDRAKPIVFVSVRCIVAGDGGQRSEATATVNDVGVGQTVRKDIYFVRQPNNVKGSMECATYDLFEAD